MTLLDELKIYHNAVTGKDYIINDRILIRHPTLSEIAEFGEHQYYGMVQSFCANSSLYKVSLWDAGVDWTAITDWQLFSSFLYKSFSREHTSILFGDLDFSKLQTAHNTQTGEDVLVEEVDGELVPIVDKAIYFDIVNYIKNMHNLEFKVDHPEDDHTKKYMVEKERKRALRQSKTSKTQSSLNSLIGSMVNYNGFKYDYSSVWDLPIFAFMDSVSKTSKFVDYIQLLESARAGASLKNIDWDKVHWLK